MSESWSDWSVDADEREDIDDGELPPFGELVAGLGDVDDDDDAMSDARAAIMTLDRVTIALSIEVAVTRLPSGAVEVRGSTPTQWTETTVMPVFHRLTMHVGTDLNPDVDGQG